MNNKDVEIGECVEFQLKHGDGVFIAHKTSEGSYDDIIILSNDGKNYDIGIGYNPFNYDFIPIRKLGKRKDLEKNYPEYFV